MFRREVIRENCSESSDSESDYKSLIPKCNDKFCIGKKKKNWKKIFTNNLVINSYKFFVKNVNNIFIIGFTPPDSNDFIPLSNYAYINAQISNNSNIAILQNNYISLITTLSKNINVVNMSPSGSGFQVLITGNYLFTFNISVGTSLQNYGGYFSITINNVIYNPTNVIGYPLNVGSYFISGSCMLSLSANDVVGLVNSQSTTISLNSTGTCFTLLLI
jgi:hypothetical protein